jgi:cytochrome c biogenesis protein CcmG, thiol:disulfide interchange protein DsbE
MPPSYGGSEPCVNVRLPLELSAGVLTGSGRLGHAPVALVWYNRSMNASRGRGAALIAALLVLAAALSPPARPFVRQAAYRLGLLRDPQPLERGRPLNGFSVVTLDGSSVVLHPRPGHAMLINVFATWCPPCQAETPLLVSLAPALQRAGVDVVGVDQAESLPQVERFTSAYGVPYPVYVDQNQTTKITLDARVIPTTLLVDRRDIVRFVYIGPLDSSEMLAMSKMARKI